MTDEINTNEVVGDAQAEAPAEPAQIGHICILRNN